jgi:hypothetical protein
MVLGLAVPGQAVALPAPESNILALDSVNRPVIRELAQIRARESQRLAKTEGRLDERIARLEGALLDRSERTRQETHASLRQMDLGLNERLVAVAWYDRILLLAVAGGYIWSAMLWIELRRVTRTLHDASVKSRIDRMYAARPASPDPEPRIARGIGDAGLSLP